MGIIADVQSSKVSLSVPNEADAADTKLMFRPVLKRAIKAANATVRLDKSRNKGLISVPHPSSTLLSSEENDVFADFYSIFYNRRDGMPFLTHPHLFTCASCRILGSQEAC